MPRDSKIVATDALSELRELLTPKTMPRKAEMHATDALPGLPALSPKRSSRKQILTDVRRRNRTLALRPELPLLREHDVRGQTGIRYSVGPDQVGDGAGASHPQVVDDATEQSDVPV